MPKLYVFNIQGYKKVISRTALRNFTGNSKIILHRVASSSWWRGFCKAPIGGRRFGVTIKLSRWRSPDKWAGVVMSR